MPNKKHSNGGFTLPELLVVLFLISLLFSFFLRCFFTIGNQHQQRLAILELEENLSLAVSGIVKDISKSTAVLSCTEEQLSLKQNKIIYYTLGVDQQEKHLYQLEGKVLYRRESTQGNRQPMANFITAMQFSYLDAVGQTTTDSLAVKTIVLCVEGCWQGKTIRQKQIVQLAGDIYL